MSKWWPNVQLAPSEHFFTAGGGREEEDDEDEDVEEEAAGEDVEEEAAGEDVEEEAAGEDDFEEAGENASDEDMDEDGEEEDVEEERGSGNEPATGKRPRVKHNRMVYVLGSLHGLSANSQPVSLGRYDRLIVSSTSFKGAAKKIITLLCRSLLHLKKGAPLKGRANKKMAFTGLEIYRVRKIGLNKLAQILDAKNSTQAAVTARLEKVNPARFPEIFVTQKHKYNGTVTFLAEDNALSTRINNKNTVVRVQVTVRSDARKHKNVSFAPSSKRH